jgi:hypothetical protein
MDNGNTRFYDNLPGLFAKIDKTGMVTDLDRQDLQIILLSDEITDEDKHCIDQLLCSTTRNHLRMEEELMINLLS